MIAERALVQQVAAAVRRHVILDRTVVEVLLTVGEEHPELLAEPTGLGQHDLGLGPGQVGAEPDGQRAELGVATHVRPLDAEVGHTGAPVLDRGIAHVRAVTHVDLGDRVAEGSRELRRGPSLDERHLRARLHDDQRVREDRRSVGVEVDEGLQRQIDLGVLRHVQEGAAGAERRVQRR